MTLLLKGDVLQLRTWKSRFLLCCTHICLNSFLNKFLFLMQINTSKIYNAVTVRNFSSLKISLQDSLICSPLIVRRILFCIFNTFTLFLSPPHKIIPHLIKDQNFVKYIFLNIHQLKSLLSDKIIQDTLFNSEHKN